MYGFMPQLKSYWLETCRVHKPIRYLLTTLLYLCDHLYWSFRRLVLFILFFIYCLPIFLYTILCLIKALFFIGSNHTMRSRVCFLSLHDSMMGLPATMLLSMSFPWRIFSHIWIYSASDDRLSIGSKVSHWHHGFPGVRTRSIDTPSLTCVSTPSGKSTQLLSVSILLWILWDWPTMGLFLPV